MTNNNSIYTILIIKYKQEAMNSWFKTKSLGGDKLPVTTQLWILPSTTMTTNNDIIKKKIGLMSKATALHVFLASL